MIWLLSALIAAAAVASLVVVILRRHKPVPPAEFDRAVYEDQLAETDRDEERGLLGPEEAAAARQEIRRRMAQIDATVSANAAPGSSRFRTATAIGVGLLVPIVGFGIYGSLGTPDFPDQPFAERAKPPPSDDPKVAEMTEIVAQLERRLEAAPARVDGWLLLGRSLVTLQRHLEAARAYARARALAPDRAEIAIALGETTVIAQGGVVSDDAVKIFADAMDLDPNAVRPHYFLGLAAAQRRDFESAVRRWTDVIALSPPDAPWVNEVRKRMNAAAQAGNIDLASISPSRTRPAGPTAEDVRAASELSVEERAEMIIGMVERLAARLEDDPDDLEGWKRLARAYRVLGDEEKAAAAEERIRQLETR